MPQGDVAIPPYREALGCERTRESLRLPTILAIVAQEDVRHGPASWIVSATLTRPSPLINVTLSHARRRLAGGVGNISTWARDGQRPGWPSGPLT